MIFVAIMVGMIVIELESFDDFDVIIIYMMVAREAKVLMCLTKILMPLGG